MLRRNNAARLQETVKGVETMTRFALAVLALASGVYTYLGVRGLLDGTATFVFFAAINQFPMYAEMVLPAAGDHKGKFQAILERRLPDLPPAKQARVEKVLRKLGKSS